MSNAKMVLQKFRVTRFRSVNDSGWIDAGDVTSFIGTNEAGKTNLLIPLWKLKPAKDGEINLLTDAPRKEYNAIREMKKKPDFIKAIFELKDPLIQQLVKITGATSEQVKLAEVTRDFGGNYYVGFPNATPSRTVNKDEILQPITKAVQDYTTLEPVDPADTALKAEIQAALTKAVTDLGTPLATVTNVEVAEINNALKAIKTDGVPEQSTIGPRLKQVIALLETQVTKLGKPSANDFADARNLVVKSLPAFVYYSTYGNLDSEIYLPHVIDDLKRTNITGRLEARARTLRVLFDFVRLQPEEILELGKDHNEQTGKATEEQIKAFNDKKKERSVLMQSASSEITQKFRDWWKQGEYRIRFEADGNHFRIWVSDDKRAEEIELEGRSTGLQWFLSFYLIFLVESKAAHEGSILLLDEPGLSLHPLAQKDLAAFFDTLSKENQLLYTTHSPFLVDADHLDRVRAVYVDEKGFTSVSSNLRQGQNANQTKSVYPVHAALGLSVSDTLFQGCRPIIVEGPSDQFYFSAVKLQLLASGQITPTRELLFVPTSGVKAIKTVASILGGKDEDLPYVVCDGDSAGTMLVNNLKGEMYKSNPERILTVTDFSKVKNAEVEDLFPKSFMSPIIDRQLKGPDEYPFVAADAEGPLMPQVEAYAKKHGLTLSIGWKVDLARNVKSKLSTTIFNSPEWDSFRSVWKDIFSSLGDSAEQSSGETKQAAGKKKAA